MGMFGKKASPTYDDLGLPEPSIGDRILNQIGMNLIGVDVLGAKKRDAIARMQNNFLDDLAQRAAGTPIYQDAPDVQFGAGGNASDYRYAAPKRVGMTPGLNINSPEMLGLAIKGQRLGVPLGPELDILKAQQPHKAYDRGFEYTSQGVGSDQNAGFHPDLEKGQEPLFDSSGRLAGVRNLDGSVQSAAEMASAVEAAKAKAQAPYQAVQTYGPGGAPKTISALDLANGGGGTGQSPAQNAADVAKATAGAQAEINLPQVLGSANQAISLIEQMKAHPGLDSRVGWRGALPALPDTPGADFSAMQDQLKGKVFLEAYGQLKGAGQITEVEGQKATQAIARLNNTQTKAGYLKALDDLEQVINAGASRAAGQASRLQPNASAPTPAAPRTTMGRSRIISVQ